VVYQEVRSYPERGNELRQRRERFVISEPFFGEICFELVDDDDDDEECLTSSLGDEVLLRQEENPSATSQLICGDN